MLAWFVFCSFIWFCAFLPSVSPRLLRGLLLAIFPSLSGGEIAYCLLKMSFAHLPSSAAGSQAFVALLLCLGFLVGLMVCSAAWRARRLPASGFAVLPVLRWWRGRLLCHGPGCLSRRRLGIRVFTVCLPSLLVQSSALSVLLIAILTLRTRCLTPAGH